jgi:hypothetical protein
MKCIVCNSLKAWFGKLIRFLAREWNSETNVPGKPAPLLAVRDRPIRIVFVVEYSEAWGSYESVYRACKSDEDCDVAVVAIAESSSHECIKNKPRDFLAAAGIPFYSSDYYDLAVHRPDVVFFHRPYEGLRPAAWQVRNVMRCTSRIVYICYGFEIGGGRATTQFNQPMQLNAWRVFVYSPLVKKLFARDCAKGDGHVVAIGHPMVDAVLSVSSKEADPAIKPLVAGRRTVLWCPHYSASKGGEDMSTFCRWHDHILREFERRPDTFLICRPHPLLFARLANEGVLQAEEIARFRQRIEEAPNMLLDESSDFRQSFAISDGMMADGGTFIMLYPSTTKPVLYLRNPGGKGLNEAGAVSESFYQADTADDITRFIGMVASGEDAQQAARMRAYREVVLMPEGGAGPAIKHHVLDAARRGV